MILYCPISSSAKEVPSYNERKTGGRTESVIVTQLFLFFLMLQEQQTILKVDFSDED